MAQVEEGVVMSTVRGSNPDVPPIEIIERSDGLTLRQAWDDTHTENIVVDETQLTKLWYVLSMHMDLLGLMAGRK